MNEDRSLFSPGRYPETGPLAVLARVAFLGSALAIAVGVYLPPSLAIHFARSHYLEHFAAFYVAALCGLAALPKARLRTVAAGYAVLAIGLEATHLLGGAELAPLVTNAVADLGGLLAACAPVVIERFRRRFRA